MQKSSDKPYKPDNTADTKAGTRKLSTGGNVLNKIKKIGIPLVEKTNSNKKITPQITNLKPKSKLIEKSMAQSSEEFKPKSQKPSYRNLEDVDKRKKR